MMYDAVTAIAVTAATDMDALVPRRYAEACANSAQVRIIDFPRDHAEMIEFSMLWHSRVHDDPGSLWLGALIRDAVKLQFEAAQPSGLPSKSACVAKHAGGRKGRRA
jgi:DNA-binding transcriptional LysR family regulator